MKPFIKWVGGKTQILGDILSRIPNDIDNYHEPFVGGGSVLLAVLDSTYINIRGNVIAYDANRALINTYKDVQKRPERLWEKIQEFVVDYKQCTGRCIDRNAPTRDEAMVSKESYYYWARRYYNSLSKHTLEKSALFIFLNKTCFRGLYREGPNGFNVPYGHYKTVDIIDKQDLVDMSKLIQRVKFECLEFDKSLANVKENDFVYLDPPYAPEDSKSFVGYIKGGFGMDKHNELFKQVNNLPCSFLMSNSNVPLVRESFSDDMYRTDVIRCRRSINSKNPGAKTDEVLIMK